MSVASGSPVWSDDKRKLVIGKLIKSGGAGSVFHLPASRLQVAKIYHEKIDWAQYERKVAAMLSLSPQLTDLVENGRRYVQIAWPQTLLRDQRGRFVGFAMPAVDVQATSELECILQERQAKAAGLPTGLGAKVTLAANLAAVIAELHKQGHHVIDLKPVNLRFYPQSLYMAMLDCDGFSIQGHDERFAAEQITPDYLAPEFHNTSIPTAAEEQQDCFALAVVIFQLLNFGIHPYSGRPSSDRVPTDIPGRIAHRCYAYGLRANPNLSPSPVSGHASMPAELRLLFDRAFESAGAPRPAAREWASVLKTYAQRSSQRLTICASDRTHQHFVGLACAACARVALIQTTTRSAQAARRTQPASSNLLRPNRPPPSRPVVRAAGFGAAQGTTNPIANATIAQLKAYLQANTPGPIRQASVSTSWQNVFMAIAAFLAIVIVIAIADSQSEYDRLWARMLQPTPIHQTAFPIARPVAQPALPSEPLPSLDPRSTQPPVVLVATQSDIRVASEAMFLHDKTAWSDAMTRLRDAAKNGPQGSRGMYRLEFDHFAANIAANSEADRQRLVADLSRVFEQNSDDSESAYELGWLALLGGDRAAAKSWFQLAIGADPEQAKAWYGFGIAVSQSEPRQTIGALAMARVLDPDPATASTIQQAFSPELLNRAGIDAKELAPLQAEVRPTVDRWAH